MEHIDTDHDGVITFDEFISPYNLDTNDPAEHVQIQLQVARRAFDKRDFNRNAALEGIFNFIGMLRKKQRITFLAGTLKQRAFLW